MARSGVAIKGVSGEGASSDSSDSSSLGAGAFCLGCCLGGCFDFSLGFSGFVLVAVVLVDLSSGLSVGFCF